MSNEEIKKKVIAAFISDFAVSRNTFIKTQNVQILLLLRARPQFSFFVLFCFHGLKKLTNEINICKYFS